MDHHEANKVVEGEWGNFVFRMIQPQDHEKVLIHLRESFYYRALYRLGYTKEMDDEFEVSFKAMLNDGHHLNFIALDKASGKIAGCRIITMEIKDSKGGIPPKNRICKGILTFYHGLKRDCDVFNRYKVDEYPHLFALSVDEEFCRQSLAIEIYRRAKELCKARGHKIAQVGFISPYSRAAGKRNGFIRLAKGMLLEAKDELGEVLYPQADPEDYLDIGVFEL